MILEITVNGLILTNRKGIMKDDEGRGIVAIALGIVGISLIIQLFFYFVIFMIIADFFDWGIALSDKI